MNIFLLLLIIGNIALGLGPLFIKFIPEISPFTTGFTRFILSTIFEFIVILILWFRIYRNLKKVSPNLSARKLSKLVWISLKNYYFGKNRFFFRGKYQFLYLSFLGFLIVGIVVPFYYLSFQLVGVIFTTIIVNSLPILFITILNWAKRTEEMDGFKIIYLFLLNAGIVSITLSYGSIPSASLSFFGFLILIITILAFILYSVYISQDSLRGIQLLPPALFPMEVPKKARKDIRLLRSFYKLIGIHFFGSLIFVILMLILGISDRTTLAGLEAHRFIFEDLPNISQYILNPFIICIAIICTLLPYTFQIISSSNWPRHELGFGSWNTVLTVLQPLIGLYIGTFIWNEPISINYIIITSIFLITSIIIRYLHESANFRLILFQIRIKNSQITSFIKYIRVFREINDVYLTFGRVGVIFHASFRSVIRLFQIVQKIQTFPGVIEVKYFSEIEYIPSIKD
ncbi:MAG: hypothetical protein K9W44_04420 [Candidatus Lokiarchaeota archaeon]|nr:hypothetical protein [Candidatus Harpocratesius repetitus]